MPKLKCLSVCTLLALSTATAHAQAGTDSAATARLATLARVWGFAKFFHPNLDGRSQIDWDAALVRAIPRVRNASSEGQFRVAVDSLLAELKDPYTAAPSASAVVSRASADGDLQYRWASDSTLVVSSGSYFKLFSADAQNKVRELTALIPRARAVVFDIRQNTATGAYGQSAVTGTFAPLLSLLSADTLPATGERRRTYYGYESAGPFSSGQYRSGSFTQYSPALRASPGARNVPAVFVLNENAEVLAGILALKSAGKAAVVYEGEISRLNPGSVAEIPLGSNDIARIRTTETVFSNCTGGLAGADVIIRSATPATDRALDSAIARARASRPAVSKLDCIAPTAPLVRDRAYPSMSYPSVEYRLLAAFRLWSVIEHFYPYKSLLDRDWDSTLIDAIPRFIAARDAKEYTLAVVGMATRLQDSHTYINNKIFNEDILGDGYPPIRVRLVEDSLVVVALYDTVAAKVAGIRVGDVVTAIDGEPASARLARYAKVLPASSLQSSNELASLSFMNGPTGSMVKLDLRRDGATKAVEIKRRHEDFNTLYHRERTTPVIRVLPGNIGYADLDRLSFDMVDSMFTQLRNTRAIIFDMRGYPYGAVYAIAPRLIDSVKVGSRIETPTPGAPPPEPGASDMVQTLDQLIRPAPSNLPRYRKATFMLMDERSVSQAEHTGLWLKAANNTTLVGSRTSGADGEVSTLTLPGSITIGFTGQRVTYPDGRQVQRIGLEPDVAVRPTINGVRAGRDEVLDAAIRLVK